MYDKNDYKYHETYIVTMYLDPSSSKHEWLCQMVAMISNLHSYEGNHYGVWAPFEERESAFVHNHIFPTNKLNLYA